MNQQDKLKCWFCFLGRNGTLPINNILIHCKSNNFISYNSYEKPKFCTRSPEYYTLLNL